MPQPTGHGLAHLGVPVAYIGKVGNDDFGRIFEDDLKINNIYPFLYKSNTDTGRAIALVSPDSERTFSTYLGSAIELTPDDLKEELFHGYDYFHIEGYLVQNHELIKTAVQMAYKNKLKISLDLASYNVVEENKEFLNDIISRYVDIVFANEDEARALTGIEQPNEALFQIANKCEIAIVKLGAQGSIIKKAEFYSKVNAVTVQSIDTTGAGDLYAAGFLYGLVQKLPLTKCAEIGSIVASKVVEVIGAKISNEKWSDINNTIAKL